MTAQSIHPRRPGRAARIARAEAAYRRRIAARVAEEEADGSVFFTGPIETGFWEVKLRGERLTVLRPDTGDSLDTQGYLLRRLERADWQPGRLRLTGEFWYQTGEGLRHVRDGDARLVRRTLAIPRPLQNEGELRAFLTKMEADSALLPPAPLAERLRGLLEAILAPLAAVGLCAVMLPWLAGSAVLYREVPGVLEGFREQGGQHYPQYRYPTGEGRWQEAVDWSLPVEKAVAAEELPALLRQKLPKAVKVRVGRFNGKSRCLYL